MSATILTGLPGRFVRIAWVRLGSRGSRPARNRADARTVAAILANPRYTGRQVWNRQPSQAVLVDPANTGLGHKQVQRWNLPEGWVVSKHPAHAACLIGRLLVNRSPWSS